MEGASSLAGLVEQVRARGALGECVDWSAGVNAYKAAIESLLLDFRTDTPGVASVVSEISSESARRRGIAAALSSARQAIWDGSEPLGEKPADLCQALWCNVCSPYSADALAIVLERLEGCGSLRAWLAIKEGVPSADLTVEAVQAHTIAWTEQMVKEFTV